MFRVGPKKHVDFCNRKYLTLDIKSLELIILQRFWPVPNFTVVNVTQYINRSQLRLYKFFVKKLTEKRQTKVN